MNRKLLINGAIFGGLSVILGAFAAHGLKELLPSDNMATFETGVRYQMYSALFLLVLSGIPPLPDRVKRICLHLTVAGILLFSGSIYLLATNPLTSFDFKTIALATPLGGSLLIAAWIVLLINAVKLKYK